MSESGEYEQALLDCILDPAAWVLGSTSTVHSGRYQNSRVGGKYQNCFIIPSWAGWNGTK